MPSVSVPTENKDYFTTVGLSTNHGGSGEFSENPGYSDIPDGYSDLPDSYSDLPDDTTNSEMDLGLDSEFLKELKARLMNSFMKQSNVINATDVDDNYKLDHCFHEYIDSVTSLDHDPNNCPVKFDGVSCWPETPPGRMRAIPCFHDFNGVSYDPSENNATLYCHPNGTWSTKSFYDFCLNVALTNDTDTGEATVFTKKTIYYFGFSLSLVAVIFALWIFLSFKDLRCLRNTIHINLLFTYLLHSLFWILNATIQILVDESIGCSFFVVLHYFLLTNFMWMFVEGLYLYMLVVKTFETENIKLRTYALMGWGVPVPITMVWLLTKTYFSMPEAGVENTDTEGLFSKGCSLMAENHIDWIQIVAILFLLCTNIIFLMRIMWVLITKLRSANNVETQRYRKATKALLVLIPLLGLTYMLLIITPKELEHIQAILLSTQGFWVAVFFCFLNSEVQNSIRHHIERWKTERGIGDTRGASVRHSRDGSPRPKFGGSSTKGRRWFGGKRDSLCTDVTTMSTVVINGTNVAAIPSVSPQSGRRVSKISALTHWGDQELKIPTKDSVI